MALMGGVRSASGTTLAYDALRAWAPIVKFDADERYFPSSVDWFLQRADLVDGHGTVQASPASANPGRSHIRQTPRSLPSGMGSTRTARRQRLQTTEPVPPTFGRPRTHSQRSTMLDLNRHGLTARGKTAAALSATVLLCLLGAATAQAVPTTTKTAIPLQATGYRYQQVGWGLGAGFEATAFDDSAWSTGQAAFGTSDGTCAVNQSPPVHTPWSINTDLLVRKSFTLPSTASAVHVRGTVDNAATVYMNGEQIGSTSTGFCAQDTIDFAAPQAVGGTNVLAVRAHDDGVASFLDQTVTYDVPVYSLCLLYDPTKSAKLGSTIPLKFQLCDADGTNLSSPTVTVHATGVAKQDNTASATAEDAGNANPDADFRYDSDLAGYIFNKTTKGLTTGTWMMTFTVGGDSEPDYYLSFDVR